jgi:pimeloyl-ACP methyl ester carboxylesterase
MLRFRLLPQQDVPDFTFEHVAHHSLKSVPERWTWKFDPELPNGVPDVDIGEILGQVGVPIDIVAGAASVILSVQRARRIVQQLRFGRGPFIVPEAGHHLMLDQPLATVAVLQALLTIPAPPP